MRVSDDTAIVLASALAWAVAWADPAEIDALNILAATMLAMRRAILGLSLTPAVVQVERVARSAHRPISCAREVKKIPLGVAASRLARRS